MRCPTCSNKVAADDKTCSSCGAKLRPGARVQEEESWRSRVAMIASIVALIGVVVGVLVLRSDRDASSASPTPDPSASLPPQFTQGYPDCAGEIAIPEGLEPMTGTEAAAGFCVATLSSSLEGDEVVQAYEDAVTDAGFEVTYDSRAAEVATPDLFQLQATAGDRCVSMTITPDPEGGGRRVTLVLGPAESLCQLDRATPRPSAE